MRQSTVPLECDPVGRVWSSHISCCRWLSFALACAGMCILSTIMLTLDLNPGQGSPEVRDLIHRLLRPNPVERLTMAEVFAHLVPGERRRF